jgi:hypothetical protein
MSRIPLQRRKPFPNFINTTATLNFKQSCWKKIGAYTVKKGFSLLPSTAEMSLPKLSLDGNNLIIPAQGGFGQ